MNIPMAIDEMRAALNVLDVAWLNDDLSAQMSAADRIARVIPDLATELVERGVHAGMTQRRMAALLGVSESALRGARREFAVAAAFTPPDPFSRKV